MPYCTWSWNWLTGCEPVSDGCADCLIGNAPPQLASLLGHDLGGPRVQVHLDRLSATAYWDAGRAKVVGVCCTGDWLHPAVRDGVIVQALNAMLLAPLDTVFLTLTKRPERLRDVVRWLREAYDQAVCPCGGIPAEYLVDGVAVMPVIHEYLSRLWIGVSVENQKAADERLPILASVDWPNKWVRLKPSLGPVELRHTVRAASGVETTVVAGGASWVVAGCETRPTVRPYDEDWIRAVRDCCQEAHIAFYYSPGRCPESPRRVVTRPVLDGRQWLETPPGWPCT